MAKRNETQEIENEVITGEEETTENVVYPVLEDAELEGEKICTPTVGNLKFALGRTAPARLNIREKPFRTAAIVCIEPKGSLLQIDYDKSNDEWYNVTTVNGAEGYCMRAFVEISE